MRLFYFQKLFNKKINPNSIKIANYHFTTFWLNKNKNKNKNKIKIKIKIELDKIKILVSTVCFSLFKFRKNSKQRRTHQIFTCSYSAAN